MVSRNPAHSEENPVWENHWSNLRLSGDAVTRMVRRAQATYRWQDTKQELEKTFGSIHGLKTIELGSGKGDVSLLLALEGADVALLDANEQSLIHARQQFAFFGLNPTVVTGDLFSLPIEIVERFQVAISWGTVEHFPRETAFRACVAHADAVCAGGLVAICVPNAWSLPYRLNKWYREVTGTWEWGLELPYSPLELREVGIKMGLKEIRLIGSSVVRDFDQFLFHPIMGRVEKYLGITTERRTPFDRMFGQAITLFGEKR